MATIQDILVKIGANTSSFEKSMKNVEKQFEGLSKQFESTSSSMRGSMSRLGGSSTEMSRKISAATKEAQQQMEPFKEQLREVEYQFYELSQSMGSYQGTTSSFMQQLTALGKQHKQVTDNMIANDTMARQSFIEGIGTMLAASTQSEKIAQNLQRIGNPLYNLSQGALSVTKGLENIAKQGTASALALKQLGSNANMKQLQDQINLINSGLGRMQALMLGMGIVVAGLTYGLSKLAFHFNKDLKPMATEMKTTWTEALRPIGEAFGQFLEKLFGIITAVGEMTVAFNTAHPVLAKVGQIFMVLVPLFTLLLAPLAIGIGLTGGLSAAFTLLWASISPFVIGFATVIGVAIALSAALVLIGLAVWALWTKCDGFREGVLSAWNKIKEATSAAWDYVLNSVLIPVWNEIVAFGKQLMGQLKDFWEKNGDNIKTIAETVWSFVKNVIWSRLQAILAVMKTIWNVVSSVVKSAWNNVKLTISGAIDIITGIIGFFAAAFTGDWKGMWENAKQILKGAWKMIQGIFGTAVDVVLGIIKGLGKSIGGQFEKMSNTFYDAGKGFMEMLKKGINDAIGGVLSKIKEVAGKIREFLPFSPAKTGPLSDLDHLDFGGPISDSIIKGIPHIRSLMSDMLALPPVKTNDTASTGNSKQITVNVNGGSVNIDEQRLLNTLRRAEVLYG